LGLPCLATGCLRAAVRSRRAVRIAEERRARERTTGELAANGKRTVLKPAIFSRRIRPMACCLVCALLACAAPARAAQDFSIEAHAEGNAVEIHTRANIRAHFAVIWTTLNDYEHLPQFVPGMQSSKVLEKHGNFSTIEQKGVMKILMFSYPIEVTVETEEHLPDSISVRVLKGNLKQLEGGYRLEPVPGRDNEFVLHWRGLIEADFSVPSFITVPLMRSNLERQFLGMVGEIERREALYAASGSP
jgi:ribosome-associated toxin RatA of RatAB toxin-antitoxin module